MKNRSVSHILQMCQSSIANKTDPDQSFHCCDEHVTFLITSSNNNDRVFIYQQYGARLFLFTYQ